MSTYNVMIKACNIFSRLFFNYEVKGVNNIPADGNIVIAANHKSNLDPIFVAGAISSRPISVLAKKELFNCKPLGKFLHSINVIPVDRDNPGISTLKTVLRELKSGNAIGIFPEGTRCKGEEFGKAKAGLAMFAIKGKAQIVPVSIVTSYKLFSKVTIYIDKPISLKDHYTSKLNSAEYEKISNQVMSVIEENYKVIKKGIR